MKLKALRELKIIALEKLGALNFGNDNLFLRFVFKTSLDPANLIRFQSARILHTHELLIWLTLENMCLLYTGLNRRLFLHLLNRFEEQ